MKDKRILGVIFDWAGTTVDFGCMAPANVFKELFKEEGIQITSAQAREPMGMNKKDHIREILKLDAVTEQWIKIHGIKCSEDVLDDLYKKFIPMQVNILKNFSKLVPNMTNIQQNLNERNIKIGSTTGYNQEMIDIVAELAKQQGFYPETVICSSDVPLGRPTPWMAIQAAMELNIYPMDRIIKVGDTIADIEEGLNASMWSIAVIDSSNEMGLSFDEFKKMDEIDLKEKRNLIKKKFIKAGAHAVINTLEELPDLIDIVNELLKNDVKPQSLEL